MPSLAMTAYSSQGERLQTDHPLSEKSELLTLTRLLSPAHQSWASPTTTVPKESSENLPTPGHRVNSQRGIQELPSPYVKYKFLSVAKLLLEVTQIRQDTGHTPCHSDSVQIRLGCAHNSQLST